jgi:anti-sigma-K factor RskA
MSHDLYAELAAAYALGALDGEDRGRFEAHLRDGCRVCETAVLEYGKSLASLAAELPPVAPPPSVKAALIGRIGGDARRARAPWRLGWAAALAAAALVVVYLGWTLIALDRELAQRVHEVAGLKGEVARQQEVLKILGSPQTQVVVLDGLKPSPAARGRMWWHREAGGFFVATGLPAIPSDKTYQLWAIAGGTPLSAGVFDVDPKGTASLRVKPPAGVEKVEVFAVTLEPAGGLPKPSGAMYLAGKAP